MIDKLTEYLAAKYVDEIDRMKGDEETAHGEEDQLRGWFIESCANGLYTKEEAVQIGKIVLSTRDIDFARWCA